MVLFQHRVVAGPLGGHWLTREDAAERLGRACPVKNKAVYLALGYTCDGHKQILGMWVEQTEGAKFWLSVMNDLKARGLKDILIAVVDGLSGFPTAWKKLRIRLAFPRGWFMRSLPITA